ncbi:MAG: outer membrane lipoprotein chaperone LolA [Bacteroidetes bacterium]|nr:outer membrane lipoprotein chaperone LolA [Bacteroidota bacterium]MBX7045464.1 outer membrane lipoprotein chaperone LolA [Ignavibacteria bacterium]
MKKISILKYVVIALTLIVGIDKTYSQTAQEIIKKTQDKYESISDAKATFSQSVKGSSGKSQSASGTIYIKKTNKYRIETSGQIIITDGTTSWTYSPKKKQVVIDNYKDDGSSFSPNKFLFTYPENFYSDLDGEEKVGSADCYVLKLSPRSKGNIKSAKIWIDKNDYIIKKVNVNTKEGSSTYTLKDVSLDAGVSSSKFTFSPPADVEVIDMR